MLHINLNCQYISIKIIAFSNEKETGTEIIYLLTLVRKYIYRLLFFGLFVATALK